jgi:hypothetical protein
VPDTLDQCPTTAGSVAAHGCPDADGDGIPDSADKCPTVAGVASAGGCPDADGDGIPDSADKCPTVAGVARAGGCPDADGDGIPDSADKCPTVAGVASAGGCPDADGDGFPDPGHGAPGKIDACPHDPAPKSLDGCTDTDHDGVPDKADKCPTQRGPREAGGCPDADRDGVPDKNDKCPKQFADAAIAISGVAPRGCPGPIKAALPFDFYQGAHVSGSRVIFSVLGSWAARGPTGSEVTLSCHGPGCPRTWPIKFRLRTSHANLIPRLRSVAAWRLAGGRVSLPAKVRVTAEITHRGALARQLTLTGTEASILRCESRRGRLTACAA